MTEPAGALALAIDSVFARLMLTYGAAKLDAFYRGQGIDVVKRFWCHELRFVRPVDILFALDSLPPEGIPNVLQFRALTRRSQPAFPALERGEYKADPAALRRVRKAMEPLRRPKSPTAWLDALLARPRSELSRRQIECVVEACAALGRPNPWSTDDA